MVDIEIELTLQMYIIKSTAYMFFIKINKFHLKLLINIISNIKNKRMK